jgi:hypothetical protein
VTVTGTVTDTETGTGTGTGAGTASTCDGAGTQSWRHGMTTQKILGKEPKLMGHVANMRRFVPACESSPRRVSHQDVISAKLQPVARRQRSGR